MVDAAVDIVASRRKGVHGAVRQAWPIHTSIARMRLFPPRQCDRLAQKDSRAIRVPQAELRMDLDPDGRGPYAIRPLRPALERPIGRPREREQYEAADRRCDWLDHAARPAVEWIGVAERGDLGAALVPHLRPDIADEDEGARPRRRGEDIAVRSAVGCETAAHAQTMAGERLSQLRERHTHSWTPCSAQV